MHDDVYPVQWAGRQAVVAVPDGTGGDITSAVVRKLVDALQDGLALVDGDGTITLASTRLEEMFGYQHAELIGRPVESLLPAHLQEAHRVLRAAYAQAPAVRPMDAGGRLVGLREDGTTFPAEISLSPVATAVGQSALAVIRDVTEARRREDLAGLTAAAVATQEPDRGQLLDTVIASLFGVGLGLHAAMDLPAEVTRPSIAEALGHLDNIIREIRDTAFMSRDRVAPSAPARLDGTG